MESSLAAPDGLGVLVGVVMRVARMHGSPVSLAELSTLLPIETGTAELLHIFQNEPSLSSNYVVRDGVIVDRVGEHVTTLHDQMNATQRMANMAAANWLAAKIRGDDTHSISISGSNSYQSAPGDDLDLFCVTKSGSMWLFLARSLAFARVGKLLGRSNVPFCLSCVMDEEYARAAFSRDRGALFARDALVANVVVGESTYADLLGTATWMAQYFPRLYSLRLGSGPHTRLRSKQAGLLAKIVNQFLFRTLGTYIRAKASFHKAMLARQGKAFAAFRVDIDQSHLMYESAKYETLRGYYSEIRPAGVSPSIAVQSSSISPPDRGDNLP